METTRENDATWLTPDLRDLLERSRLVLHEYTRLLERPGGGPPAPTDAASVIRAAEAHPLGVKLVLCAPLETAAITFGVHPDVVEAARALLEARGIRIDAADREP